MKNIVLNNGVEIPQIGLGTFRTPDGIETENSVRWALEAGYTHIDTAKVYNNEGSVGKAVEESGIARDKLFITTKLGNDDNTARDTRGAFERSLELLRTDYVDLYLIHWPVEGSDAAWKEMEKLYEEKKIRAIGVSNFQKQHLDKLEKMWNIVPAVNQIEVNPYFTNVELVDYCFSKGIAVEAYMPLGGSKDNRILLNDIIKMIAADHNKSAAQICLKWALQRGIIVLPKSVHENRIVENIDLFDFDLSEKEMAAISALERDSRSGGDPNRYDF